MKLDLFSKKTKPQQELVLGDNLVHRTNENKGKFSLHGTFDESKMKRYREAMEKKAILMDQEDKHGVDYTHCDFILSTGCSFHKGMTNLVAIQLFWKGFYPYLKNLMQSYERFYQLYRGMIDDQETVLSKHAELDFRYKWTKEWLKDKTTADGKSLGWQLECFINQKVDEAKKANPAPKTRAVDELPDVQQEG